jgi:hypothetical protein
MLSRAAFASSSNFITHCKDDSLAWDHEKMELARYPRLF